MNNSHTEGRTSMNNILDVFSVDNVKHRYEMLDHKPMTTGYVYEKNSCLLGSILLAELGLHVGRDLSTGVNPAEFVSLVYHVPLEIVAAMEAGWEGWGSANVRTEPEHTEALLWGQFLATVFKPTDLLHKGA